MLFDQLMLLAVSLNGVYTFFNVLNLLFVILRFIIVQLVNFIDDLLHHSEIIILLTLNVIIWQLLFQDVGGALSFFLGFTRYNFWFVNLWGLNGFVADSWLNLLGNSPLSLLDFLINLLRCVLLIYLL